MISATTSSPTSKDVKDVYSHIFNGYDKWVRPVWNQSHVVTVTLSFKLNSINEFDEKSQKLVLAASTTYLFHLQRRPKFFMLTINIAPVVLLAFLNVCVFLIPLSSGEKNSFCVTVYLSYAVFLGTISYELPHNSKDASYLTIYLLALLVFSVTIFLVTVIQVRLFIEYGDTPVPASVAKMFGCCTRGNCSKVKRFDINDPDDVKKDSVKALEDPELKQTNENSLPE
ncbi:uncharacterized protein LOC110462885 [Mizuhopecten yessoensis]|uniref:uncharacterized protein LOC110462885 n=1 Tax=Mizuhopecten yessoensis TaxID=6573 RepID=UPI000B4576BA|nr:uncharacterized protein LOC110462885 [Mizuhopecten yessoensis]